MIKIERSAKPNVLAANDEKWTEEFLEKRRLGSVSDTVRYRYRHREIKETLRADAYDKCVFCESKISHNNPGQTDHIAPVSERPDLYVDWYNLAYVCEECNRRKGTYYDTTYPLVNPYEEEPSQFLVFYGPLVFHQPNCERGRITKRRLGLSRSALYEKREEKLEYVHEVLEKYQSAEPGAYKDVMREELEDLMDASSEYAAATRAFVAAVLGEVGDAFELLE